MKAILIILLTLGNIMNAHSQKIGSVIIDCKSKMPIPNVKISNSSSDLTFTNNGGRFEILKNQVTDNVIINFVGFHTTYIDAYSLSIGDTIYLFGYKSKMTETVSKFQENKNIRNGKIAFSKRNLTYEYTYDDSDLSLELRVINKR